jgi:hypothetical protein
MRIYINQWQDEYYAHAPEVPGSGYSAVSVEEAVAGCRQRISWEAIWQFSRDTFLNLSDEELAMVRVDLLPAEYAGGGCSTVRQALDLTIAHAREHFEQMKTTTNRR